VQETDPKPKIILFIARQDEQKAMQELGLKQNRDMKARAERFEVNFHV